MPSRRTRHFAHPGVYESTITTTTTPSRPGCGPTPAATSGPRQETSSPSGTPAPTTSRRRITRSSSPVCRRFYSSTAVHCALLRKLRHFNILQYVPASDALASLYHCGVTLHVPVTRKTFVSNERECRMPFWICSQEKAHVSGEIYRRRELSALESGSESLCGSAWLGSVWGGIARVGFSHQ